MAEGWRLTYTFYQEVRISMAQANDSAYFTGFEPGYDETQADFVVEPLEYALFVGAHSLDQHALRARFVVHGN